MSKSTSKTKKSKTVSSSKRPQGSKSKTVSTSKKSQGSKSKGTKTKAAKKKVSEEDQRATWTEIQDFDLLNKFFDARNERELATDTGIKIKAWNILVAELNTMHKRKLSKDQYKSKFARLMHDYDLYKHIRSLRGAGMDSDTTPTRDDDV
ncbi:Myb/SANT-like DNA-binding domain [Phytophthora infestans]|uniref:Myb/SANT-like DNA-binding domain n=1 Tax=Phytophthora infestans TaxID=4787 RepID=A0A833S778_PHYIN|nr:Myb/SANT-like DNA-binding domain [Phytophthora infestans]KAF4137840.1 Myb/SANT-like DNA-binding domain [Phytophthora infestans]KAI9997198.1 hypothetical protein PInf_000634 [Phytophthora infestans]